jgi:hypothetical protein
MLFNQFAHRLGITSDVVISPLDTSVDYFFNRVILNDGSYEYYDVSGPDVRCRNMTKENDLIIFSINAFYR